MRVFAPCVSNEHGRAGTGIYKLRPTSLGGSTRPPLVDSSPGAIFLSADGQHDPLDPEPAGDLGTSFRTVATNIGATYGKYGEKTYSGVRRFVVIKEGEQSCAALPIRSYSGHGAANRRDQAENGIVYTGRDAPERPAMEPKLLPLGIRVDPDDRDEKLDALSRINYGTVYIIEHNIKVKPYGVVNRDYIRALLQQFERVFVSRLGLQSDRATGAPSPKARALTRNPEHSTSQDDSRRSRDRNVPEDSKARHIAVAIAIERGRNSRARLQELADKPRSNEKRRDSGSQEHSQLTDLTNDERQELRSMFTRAMGVLTTTGGLSEEDAQEEAQRIVRTEVAKMISNNRERSRSDMPRESLSGKAQATFPISSTPRSSSLQPMTPALRAGKSALTGPAAQAIRDSATMRPGQVLNTVGQPDLRTQLTGRTRQPPNFRSAGPSVNQRSATEPIPTIAQLISGGWNENDATVFRQLMIDGWTADSATTIIRLIQKGVQLSDAKRIALMIENDDHLTLEDAVRLYQATRIH
nr:hypothetical protein B0A51_03191 [Rachicladosporium sp. CCFEE 5018]